MNPNDNSNTGSTDAAAGQQGTDQAAAAATDTVSTDADTAGATDDSGEQAAAAAESTGDTSTDAAAGAAGAVTTDQATAENTGKPGIFTGPINMIAIEDDHILAIGHDTETHTLAVRFKDRDQRLYHYSNVDAELFDRLRHATPVSKFFFEELRPHRERFPYVRINEEPVAQAA